MIIAIINEREREIARVGIMERDRFVDVRGDEEEGRDARAFGLARPCKAGPNPHALQPETQSLEGKEREPFIDNLLVRLHSSS